MGIANSGCGGRALPDTNVTGSGGAGGAGGAAIAAACASPDATDFAEITAPSGDSLAEAVLAVGDSEVGLAYTQWHDETRDVTVYLQRYALDGTPQGAPALLHTYNESAGQFASGDIYGRPSVATDGTRFVACWGEGNQLGCAGVDPATGEPSFHGIPRGEGSLVYVPHVAFGPAGFRVFFNATTPGGSSVALDAQANTVAVPISVPGIAAAPVGLGFAVVPYNGATVFFLGSDLAQQGDGIDTPEVVHGITSIDGDAIVVGERTITRVPSGGQATTVNVTGDGPTHPMAVAARKSDAGVVWGSSDLVLRFKELTPGGIAGSEKNVGCAAEVTHPTIAAVPDGYLIAAARPEGEHELFYAKGYPKLRITHLAVP